MKKISKSAMILLIAASMFMSACGQQIEDITDPPVTTPPTVSEEESTTTKEKNVPSFTVATTTETTPATTTQPTTSNDERTGSSSEATQQTSVTPVTEHSTEATTAASTNESGEVVDDPYEGLVFNTEDPDELYDLFGLSRSEREAYYEKISAECEFPIIHVSTENEKNVVSRENYVNCLVEVFNCDDFYVMDATSAGIRVRGNASAYYGDESKILKNGAPYRIKFTNKQNMLGLNDDAACKSWVLLKTYDTAVSDYLGLKLAKAINNGDYYTSDCMFVQLYMNEKYMGVYVLCEQTQANNYRIDIEECEEGYTGTDIGYLVELDNYWTSEDWYFLLNFNKEKITDDNGVSRVPRTYGYSIKSDIYSDNQLKFIERYFEVAYEVALRAIRDGEYYKVVDNNTLVLAQEEFSSARECIEQIWDVQSVVDMYITQELINNQDVGGGSFYFAVDFSEGADMDKLTMVSPWDFDWAYSDYSSDADGGLYVANFKDSYFVENWGDRSNPWLILFYSADWFKDMVKETWQDRVDEMSAVTAEVRATVENNTSDLNKDGTKRTGRAKAIINWVEDRIEYLDSLWG